MKDRLAEQGADVKVGVNEINKLNESYEALTVTPEGSNIGVNVSIDKFYNATQNGVSYEDVVDKAVDVIHKGIEQQPEIDVAAITDYEQMKGKLVMEVVSAEANKDMLENIPHQDMEDMAVVYRFVLDSGDDGRASILVTNNILEYMGEGQFYIVRFNSGSEMKKFRGIVDLIQIKEIQEIERKALENGKRVIAVF